ncbi:VirB8/TrbF family protein, partial [Escherichia coli]|nr:VirB8/TrbF family protein [Escherichia coli]
MFKRNPKKLNEQERAEIYDKNKKMAELTAPERKQLDADKSVHLSAIAGFQRDRVSEQRRMMWIGFGFGGIGIVAAGAMAVALAFITPLKEVKPYIAEVDQVTGQVNIVSAVGDDKIKLTYQSLVDASNLANFVVERES